MYDVSDNIVGALFLLGVEIVREKLMGLSGTEIILFLI